VPYLLENEELALYDNFFGYKFVNFVIDFIYVSFFSTHDEYINCEYIAIPAKYDFKPYAYGFQKMSPLLGPFNYFIKQLKESGTINKIQKNYDKGQQFCPDYSGQPLGFPSVFTAFMVFILGLIVAAVLFIIEQLIMVSSS